MRCELLSIVARDPGRERGQVRGRALEDELPRLQARDVEEPVREPLHPTARAEDRLHRPQIELRLRAARAEPPTHQLRLPEQDGERRAQVVSRRREEVVLQAKSIRLSAVLHGLVHEFAPREEGRDRTGQRAEQFDAVVREH